MTTTLIHCPNLEYKVRQDTCRECKFGGERCRFEEIIKSGSIADNMRAFWTESQECDASVGAGE